MMAEFVEFNEVEEEFVEFEQAPITKNGRDIPVLAGHMASIRNAIDPSVGIDEHYLSSQSDLLNSTNPSDAVAATIAEFNQYHRGLLSGAVEEEFEQSPPEEVAELVQAAVDVEQETINETNQEYGLEIANVLAVEGTLDRSRAERMLYERTIATFTHDQPTFEKIVDFAGLLLPDAGFDADQLSELYGLDESVDAFKDVEAIFNRFRSLPQETRLKIFPHMFNDFVEAYKDFGTENEQKAVIKMMELIDPTTSQTFERLTFGFDWATLGVAGVVKLVKGAKAVNTISRINQAGDAATAARANTAAASDSAVATEIGVDRVVAASNMNPLDYERVLPEATDGLAAETTKLLDDIELRRKSVQRQLDAVKSGKGFLPEAALTAKEQATAQAKGLQHIEDLGDTYRQEKGWAVESAEIVDSTEEGFAVSYKLNNMPVEQKFRYNVSDIDGFDVVAASAVETKVFSPSTWMDRILTNSVDAATRLGYAQQNVLGQLRNAAKLSMKGLGRKERAALDDVLLAGDDFDNGVGTTFTIMDLKYNGITTPNGVRYLNDKQIEGYFAQRDIFDSMWLAKNKQVRDDLQFNNFKHVSIGDGGVTAIGKAFDTPGAVPTEARTGTLFDSRTGKVVDGASMDTDGIYASGHQVIKANTAFDIGEESFTFAIVKGDAVQELPFHVLNKKKGYVPKAYENGFYFVKSEKARKINGKRIANGRTSTHRVFDNKTDAEKWAAEQNELEGGTAYKAFHDRELPTAEQGDEIIREAGGLITGHRATHQLKYGLNGDTPLRISAHEAMARNMHNISTQIPMNQWRMGMVQRWVNSVPPSAKTAKFGFESPLNLPAGKQRTALEASRTWIRDQMRLPTPGEQQWSASVREMAEWMEKVPGVKGAPRRGMMNLASKDLTGSMRAGAFHSLLGWFNPAQLWVQAQGAAVALAVDGVTNMPKRLQELTALRAAYFTRANPGSVKSIAKAAGMDPKELADTLSDLQKSGLYESVKSTADYAASQQGFGIAREAISSAADKGLIFFSEGERFTRGYSFLTARAAWKKANPGKVVDNEGLREILTNTTRKMLNLNRANRAHWQKGVWGVPTQFMQVTAKFIEAMMPNIFPGANKNFTAGQKAKIMAGQVALYGAAGVPFGKWMASEIANMSGTDLGDPSSATAAAVTDGAWGAMTQFMFDERLVLGERGGVLSGAEQLIERVLIDGMPLGEVAAGAFGEVPSRVFKGIAAVSPLLMNADEISVTDKELKLTANSLLDVISTWRNAHKAIMWSNLNQMVDSKGRAIIQGGVKDDLGLLWGQALGFSPRKLSDFYNTKSFLKTKADLDRQVSTSYQELFTRYISKDIPSEASQRNFAVLTRSLFEGAGIPPNRAREIKANVFKQMNNSKDLATKQKIRVLKSWFKDNQVTAGTDSVLFNSGFTKD